jgi:small subunit ribosomal protein S21
MLIVPVKEGESIERALKKYKRKFEKTGVVKQLRQRQAYTKSSVVRRDVVKRAIFREKMKEVYPGI